MVATFSWETQEMLERADRAIKRSIDAREESARGIAEAQKWLRFMETNMYQGGQLRKEAAPANASERSTEQKKSTSSRVAGTPLLTRAPPHGRP
jgi:hypothetical protein